MLWINNDTFTHYLKELYVHALPITECWDRNILKEVICW